MDLEHIGGDNICGEEEQGRPIVLSIAVTFNEECWEYIITFMGIMIHLIMCFKEFGSEPSMTWRIESENAGS